MATPNYLGGAQSNAGNSGGLLARIGSYFGSGGTPAYAGKGQPRPVAGGLLRPSSPAYAAAPMKELNVEGEAAAKAACDAETTACPIDPEALASGHIAIVIPRGT